ncbi:amino acid adenylation domain-containing protein [Xylariaceae sp. FL0255]|nr:amino acid adenylation domain-containing protein [Xylariaceae sp. FL0255]
MSQHPPTAPVLGKLSVLNKNPTQLPGPQFLHDLVASTSRHTSSPAVHFLGAKNRETIISYEKLHAVSNSFATRIFHEVEIFQQEENKLIIPILSAQTPQFYTAVLAILKAGGAFCPIHIDAPKERIKFILQDVRAKVILVSEDLASKIPSSEDFPMVISIDNILNEPHPSFDASDHRPKLAPGDLAYIMYTSGSTGTPKGVGISHLAATQSLLAHDRHIPSFSRFLQFAAPTFDVSVFEIFFPFHRGATLIGCSRAALLTDLAGVMRKMNVDACELTPSVVGSLLRQRSRVPRLRLLLTIGEMLTAPIIEEFGGNEAKPSLLWGMYGPTEATIHCTLQADFSTESSRQTIGKPLDTVSVFISRIQDESSDTTELDILPVGDVGELVLGGYQLAIGYLNRPEQTSASFINTTWGRLYRTGDKARIRPDGTLECLGRIDDNQVKINGQRLELGEIENVFLQTSGCRGAFATVISNVLVAFAEMEDDVADPKAQLLDQCKSWLPAFMIPTETVVMECFPQLSSGKLDKKRLVLDYEVNVADALRDEEEDVEDEEEEILCKIASQILGQPINPSSRLPTVRLDSLAAIEYASLLREHGLSVHPADILSVNTPRQLRTKLRTNSRKAKAFESMPLPLAEISREELLEQLKFNPLLSEQVCDIVRLRKCSTLQKAMVAETLRDSRSYVNQVELEITSDITIDILHRAIESLIERHEILRTGFEFIDDELHQVIWARFDEVETPASRNGPRFIKEDIEIFLLHPLKIQIQPYDPDIGRWIVHLTLHHSVYDGWSIDLILEDLSMLIEGREPPARPHFSQMEEIIESDSDINSDTSMEFWAEHLRGCGSVITPNLKSVANTESNLSFATTKLSLDSESLHKMRERYSIGSQVVFQACLAWLIGAMKGTEDVVLGCVSSGRVFPIVGIDKVIGPCMTTLPLRTKMSQYKTIDELLQNIHSTNRASLRHGHTPLSQIKKAAGLSATSTLFDVIFVYQESLPVRRGDQGIIKESWHMDATEAPLLVEIQPYQDHFICQITWQTDIYDGLIVEMIYRHLDSLVSYFTNNPSALVSSIPQGFSQSSLSHFNIKTKSAETFRSLSELVEITARQFPLSEALCFASSISSAGLVSHSVPYHTLNAMANQIARHLQLHCLQAGNTVAVIMHKSLLLYCSILAILKAGCAYLPILPSTPPERVHVILSQAQPAMCVVDTASSALPLAGPSRSLTNADIVNVEAADLSLYDDTNINEESEPSDLAYVIYTSGTTGVPKGVSVTNKNILSNIRVLSDIYPHQPSQRMLQACSQAFDVAVFEIFFTWANGMCLCSTDNNTLFEDFELAVRAFDITHLSLTVTVASLLTPENVPNVQFLVTSGEPMTDAVLDMWAEHLYQGYGPSETTNICTIRKVKKGDSSQYLGWALENTSTFVLSPGSTDLMPLTCVGELCFGGDQVAAGYLNSAEATNRSFINHPSYGRLYRSGDLGRMLPDGSLIILGRLDTQVKLRGMRIELREIEAIALKSGIARTCKTMVIQLKSTRVQQLALFFIPYECNNPLFRFLPLTEALQQRIENLRAQLEAHLPNYMVPTYIFPISALPLTASDKVDERTLSSSVNGISADILSACSSYKDHVNDASDWTELEILIADTIADVLKVTRETLQPWTSFSSLGIDSITAIPITRRLRNDLQKRIPLTLMIQNSNIRRLASAIRKHKDSTAAVDADKPLLSESVVGSVLQRFNSRAQRVSKVLPCTPLQQAMVMASASATTSDVAAYYNQLLLKLNLPSQVMMDYWNKMIRRHEILRACFVTTDDLQHPAVQAILEDYQPEWELVSATAISLDEEASQLLATASKPISSDRPPLSLAIITIEDSTEYLSFICHHAMYDGISTQIILSEIEAIHKGDTLSLSPPLEPFYSAIQVIPPEQEAFWNDHFAGFKPSTFSHLGSVDGVSSRSSSIRASSIKLSFVESELRSLGVSLLALCQAAWAVTLSLARQSTDVSFGHVVSGRSLALDTIDKLVAPCFNTLPMRMDLSRTSIFLDSMQKFQGLSSEMMQYQFTSLRRIQKQLSPQQRLFDTLLILQPQLLTLDDSIWSLRHEEGLLDIPLVCEVVPSKIDDVLVFNLHRDPAKFSDEATGLLGMVLSHIIETCLKYPSSHIPKIDALPLDWQNKLQQLFSSKPIGAIDQQVALTHFNEVNWSPIELKIRKTLAALANVPEKRIGRFTPIYHYGLDSIGAIQLATLLRRDDIFVSALDVIEHSSCAGIASSISNKEEVDEKTFDFGDFAKQVENEILQTEIDATKTEVLLPCTAMQQGMLSRFIESEGKLYFNYSSWTLDSAIPSHVIASAWERLVAHHQILRTGFVPVSHHMSSFAMLVYRYDNCKIPLSVHHTNSFDLERWRSNASLNALRALALPPWQVAIVAPENQGEASPVTMHISIHHALYDAFTLQLLLRSLSEIMQGNTEIRDATIQPALFHYYDMVQSSEATGEEFWRKKAGGFGSQRFPVLTPLHVESSETLSVSRLCKLSSSVMRRIAAKMGVTMQAALQATWARLVSAYTGEPRVTFGVVLDCRITDIARQSTLPMINTLPIIAENSPSNDSILQQMMRYNSELRRYQSMPITLIQRFLGSTDIMFDTILVYQANDSSMKPLPFRVQDEIASVEYPISLEIEESHSDITMLNLAFKANVLPPEQAKLLLTQFDALLQDVLSPQEDTTSTRLSDRPDLYSILAPKYDELPVEASLLHKLMERTATLQPEAPAFEFIDEVSETIDCQKWTYQQLNDLGNQVANFIVSHKISASSIIATCFPKCPIAYFAHLGILKAGCALLCLDPTAPVSRQRFIIDDSKAAMLLCEDQLEWTSEVAIPVIQLTESKIASYSRESPVLNRPIAPGDICYCLYTSGTTGAPKGCLITHDNTVQAMAAFRDLFFGHWDSSSRWLQFAAFHFDVSVLEQYWSWYVGITVVAVPKDVILSDLTGTITTLGVTHIDLTPSLARLTSPEECPSLCRGIFITGGEKLRSDILQTWGSKRVIYNAYGPTEATIGVTMQLRVPENGRPSNIGNLFPNVGGYVFEPGTDIPVLRGGVGELCLSGKLVGKGYLNRDDLTNERFPTLHATGEKIYRTGDLVRVMHDDSIDFLGRADDQVKLRGQRLEIGEINHTIKEALADKASDVTTVVTKRVAQDADLLISFISLASSSKLTNELNILSDKRSLDLARIAQDSCRNRLSTYMVPTYIFCLAYIPLSSNNKVDANRLKKIFSDLSNEQLQALATSSSSNKRSLNALERVVVDALSHVVRVEGQEIRPTTTLFQLGVDSITIGRLARHLRSAGFVSASPSLILRHPQIRHLSRALHRSTTLTNSDLQMRQAIEALKHRYTGVIYTKLGVKAGDIEYIAPCTALQEGILARSETSNTNCAYLNQFQLDLEPHADVNRLKPALESIANSLPILRTAFIETSDGYLQVAIKGRPLQWFEVETNAETFEKAVRERHLQWLQNQDRFLEWPFQVDHVQSDGKHYLLLRLIHAIYDAPSLGRILAYVTQVYMDKPLHLATSLLSALYQGPLLSHERSYPFWQSLLEHHHNQAMPSLLDNPASLDGRIYHTIEFQGLERRRKELEVTHQTMLQAAWLSTLRHYFAYAPTIGVLLSGRSLPIDNLEDVIGPLFNTLPLHVDIADGETWVSLAQKIQEYNTGILTFEHTPLRDIQKLCNKGQPLFDTLFSFDREFQSTFGNEPSLWTIRESPGRPDYPLAIEVILVGNETLQITIVAQGHIADDAALQALLARFEQYLEQLVASADTVIPSPSSTTNLVGEVNTNPFQKVPTSNSPDTTSNKLQWTDQASQIRHEVAVLAGVNENQVSEFTNLFALGLDSVDVIKLSGRLKRLGHDVSVSKIMKNPTLGSIITSLERQSSHDTTGVNGIELENMISILRDYCGQYYPDSLNSIEAVLLPLPLQDSMVAEMVLSDFQTYFNHDVIELPVNIDLDRLQSALSNVYASSPILRTGFMEIHDPRVGSAYFQVIRHQELEIPSTTKISGLDGISAITDHARIRAIEAKGSAHLFQVHFAQSPTNRFLVLSISHALYDGWSLHMLHKDIRDAYEDVYTPRAPYEPYLRHMLQQANDVNHRFWEDLLLDVHPTVLPAVHGVSNDDTVHRVERVSRLSAMEIRALCKKYHVTPQVLIQGCWAAVLASLAKSLDIVFGVVLSGRDTEEAQNLMFPTMNTVPVRVVLHGGVSKFLEYLQDIMSTVIEHQRTPLRDISKIIKIAGSQLFNTLFLLQNTESHQFDEVNFLKSVQSAATVEYPVCVELELTGTDAIWWIACDASYMSSEGTQDIGNALETVLDFFSRSPQAQILGFDENHSKSVAICGLKPIMLNSRSQKEEQLTTQPRDKGILSDDLPLLSEEDNTLLDVLAEVSQVNRSEISLDQSIFHIGLDSISAIKACSILRKRGLQISVRALTSSSCIRSVLKETTPTSAITPEMRAPTLGLNSLIDGTEVSFLLQRAGLDFDSVGAVLPAIPMQVHTLTVWQASGGSMFFPNFSFSVSGSVSLELVSEACKSLVDEMAMLRTHFVTTTTSTPPFLQVALKPEDARKCAVVISESDSSTGHWRFVYSATPFAVIEVLRRNPPNGIDVGGEHGMNATLNLCLHHGLYDAVSLPVILQRFAELCGRSSDVTTTQPVKTAWHDFVSSHGAGSTQVKRKSFWTSYLSESCVPQFMQSKEKEGVDRAQDVNNEKPTSEFRRHTLLHGDTTALRTLSSKHGVSIQSLLYAVYAKVFAKRRRIIDDNCVFGIYLANRANSHLSLQDAPYPTLTILPLLVRRPLGMDRGVDVLAAEIQRDILDIGSRENSTSGLWEINAWTGVKIDSYVNILGVTGSVGSASIGSGLVTLEERPGPTMHELAQYVASPEDKGLVPNLVRESYTDSMDIEIALRGESLDIGVFGSSRVVSPSEAGWIIEEIVEELVAGLRQ